MNAKDVRRVNGRWVHYSLSEACLNPGRLLRDMAERVTATVRG